MLRIKYLLNLLAATLLLVMVGCASSGPTAPEPEMQEPVETEAMPEVAVEPEPIKPMVSGGKIIVPIDAMDAEAGSQTLQGVFYFDFDQAIVRRDGHAELDQHAAILGANARLSVRLEGHADERGTREYNLALGENRALAVKEILGLYDLSSRIEVISFGEERPIAQLHDESAWQQNRRVEFIYQ